MRLKRVIIELQLHLPTVVLSCQKKITINLAPADLRKEGASYDLPIAIGILVASGQISSEILDQCSIMGELALDGGLRPIKGVLLIALQAQSSGLLSLLLPSENANEAAVVDGLAVYGFDNLKDLVAFLEGKDFPKTNKTF